MLLALCHLPGFAVAQTADYTTMSLKELMGLEVFTSASLLPTQASRAAGTVYSFKREDFKRFGVRRLEDLLQLVPGIQTNQYRKRHKSIWARGLLDRYNDKLVLLVDGVQVRHFYYGHFSLGDNFPLERIEKVEVILGPASSLYGANAFGGIVSVTTRDFAQQPSFEATVEGGNHSRAKATGLYNSTTVQVFGSLLDQDAPFREERRSFIGGPTLQPLAEDYTTLFIKARPVAGLTLMLDYSESETPFLFIPQTQDAHVQQRMLTLAANYEAGSLDSGKLEASLHYSNDKGREYELEQQSRKLGYRENQNAVLAGASIKGLRRLGDHTLATGASWQQEAAQNMDFVRHFSFREGFLPVPITGSLLSDPKLTNDNYAAFVQDVWTITPALDLTAGARFDSFDQFGSHLNYRSALVYSPSEHRTWKLMYGTAIRVPGPREYLKVLETDFVPPKLEPERLRSLELGYTHHWDQASIAATLYRNKVEDFILEAPTPDGVDEYFVNLADTWTLEGAETLLTVMPGERLKMRLGASYLEVRGSRTNDVPYLANWTASFHADYRLGDRHQLGLSLTYNSDRPETNDYPGDRPGSFVTTNIFASGTLTRQLSYALGIDNLFDDTVYDPAGDFGARFNSERHTRELWLRLEWSLTP